MSILDLSPEQERLPRPYLDRPHVVAVGVNLLANVVPEGPIDEVPQSTAEYNTTDAVAGVEKAAVDYINAISDQQAESTVEKKVAGFVVESEANNVEDAQNKVREAFTHDN